MRVSVCPRKECRYLSLRKPMVILLTVILLILALPLASVPTVAGLTFGSPQAIELTPAASRYPSTLQASDGKIWITWQQDYETGLYMTYSTGSGWSVIQSLPTGHQFVISPSLAQLRNSSIMLLWSSNNTGRWNIYYKLYSNGAWHNAIRLTIGSSFDDFFPVAAVSANSTVYVFWERYFSSTSAPIYYKTLKGSVWSGDIQLSSPSNVDVKPTAVGTFDGKIRVAWSRLVSGNYYIYYRTYDGISWSAESSLTSNNYDLGPNLVQDRNGTIWIFWSRQIKLSSGANAVYEQKLFYKTTFDGSSWSPDTQLTFYGDVNLPLDDFEPSVVQGVDKNLWIFYSTDYPLGYEYDIYLIKSSSIFPVHNVVIRQVQPTPYVFQETIATILVTVSNVGDFSETILVTITAANLTTYTIASGVSKTVPAGSTTTFSFTWNTTLVQLGKYTVTVTYPRLTGQSILASGGNTMQYKSLTLLPPFEGPACHGLRNCPN